MKSKIQYLGNRKFSIQTFKEDGKFGKTVEIEIDENKFQGCSVDEFIQLMQEALNELSVGVNGSISYDDLLKRFTVSEEDISEDVEETTAVDTAVEDTWRYKLMEFGSKIYYTHFKKLLALSYWGIFALGLGLFTVSVYSQKNTKAENIESEISKVNIGIIENLTKRTNELELQQKLRTERDEKLKYYNDLINDSKQRVNEIDMKNNALLEKQVIMSNKSLTGSYNN